MADAKNKSGARPFHFQQSGALLRNVIENAAVATFLVRPTGTVLYANRALGELLGRDRDEVVGLGIAEIVHPDDAAVARAQTADLVARKIDSYRAERRYIRKDGKAIWVLASASAIINERTGRPLYLTVQAIDIFELDFGNLLVRPEAPVQGGELDTSLLLHLAPELVHMQLSQDFALSARSLQKYRPGQSRHLPLGSPGSVGYPSLASPQKGALIVLITAKVPLCPATV